MNTKNILPSIVLAALVVFPADAQQRKIYPRAPYTAEQLAYLNSIPQWKAPKTGKLSKGVNDLPACVDNSVKEYFPAVFEQRSNSCSQASGIRYVYTYEVNRMLNRAATAPANVFSYLFTWNYLNEGNEEGAHPESGYLIAKTAGVPSLDVMNDDDYGVNYTTWMTGYDKYIAAMKYRVKDEAQFSLKTQDGINSLKQYIYNEGVAGQPGGVATFSCYASDWTLTDYSGASGTDIKYMITKNGTDGAHALTIAGYDDNVEYDLNGDGTITADEKGAFIVVNSWGTYFGTKGRAYYPYKLFLLAPSEGGLSNLDANALCISTEEHTPLVVFKVKITYDSRNDLSFTMGVGDGADATEPDFTMQYPMMLYQGGDLPMMGARYGGGNKTIEVALDFTDMLPFFKDFKEPKFFLSVRRIAVGAKSGTGSLNSLEVDDYRTGKVYLSPKENIDMTHGITEMSTSVQSSSVVSFNAEPWKTADSTLVTTPYILRRADGTQMKMQFEKSSDGIKLRYHTLP